MKSPRLVRSFACAVWMAIALCSLPAAAEVPASLELGAFGGWHQKSDNNELGNGVLPTDVPVSAAGLGGRLGYAVTAHLSLEGEVKYVLSTVRSTSEPSPIIGLRAFGLWNFLQQGRVRPFIKVGAGGEWVSSSAKVLQTPSDIDSAALAGLGVRVGLTKRLLVRLDAVALVVPGRDLKKEVELEGWLGLGYLLGVNDTDTDGDGVLDEADRCPTQAEDKDGWQDQDGCPDPDNDGDGIIDSADLCPSQAEVKNGVDDTDGCPDSDRDGDLIEDKKDKCPDQPETKNGFQDEDGCPDQADTDHDGIADDKDKCVKEPETKNGWQDEDGCPDKVPDTDKDGVDDLHDKCPKEKETANSYQDDDGCPDVVPDKLKKYAGAMRGIEFEVGSAKIVAKSFPLLDGAVTVLAEYKDTQVEISGHTDDVGTAELNKKLSLDRAQSVKAYLVSKGIAAERIQTVGFGPDKPVASNKTAAGKAKNRRIEFKLL